jgi:5-methyltetrahydrofolate--homocysteine methyltransferase
METIIKTIYTSILNGQKDAAISGMQAAVNAGLSPVDILKEAIVDAMTDASHLFESGKYFAPEMLITARAMQAAMGILKPYLTEADVEAVGPEKIFIGKEIALASCSCQYNLIKTNLKKKLQEDIFINL